MFNGKGRYLQRPLLFVLAVVWGVFTPAHAFARTTRVVLLHFSDYHSHAQPFFSEGREAQGGIARAIGYLKREKRDGALVFSGGDMINKGSPAWSDKYRCAEWPWFDGVIDAMALGNHEPDYGSAAMQECLGSIHFPVLSANTDGFRASRVFIVKGIRLGVFAIAGSDFKSLVKEPALHFGDATAAARNAVRDLRETQHADVVVMIGHEHLNDDFALARAVPGIDIIFGSHSHLKRELMLIEGTSTWLISPFQYLAYISRVELVFQGHKLAHVNGHLIPVDTRMPVDKAIASKVAIMQRDLERDPQYAPLFESVGTLAKPISVDELAARSVEIMRDAAHTDVALSTASSFRQALGRGPVTLEALRAALPYDNEILVYEMRGDVIEKLLAYGDSLKGGDSYAIVAGSSSIDREKMYRVATTDYLAKVAVGYRDFFAGPTPEAKGLHVRDEVRKRLAAGQLPAVPRL
ncbi:MAG: 5-nucleotidase / UDP-sugar diphosphatase [Thermoanaerobaculia bacterium]|jgi:5'-nucleotidase|nr:5-nucleotidase / UDP-sugar diphosphatase [Thermoanaerobaculia bacterium]